MAVNFGVQPNLDLLSNSQWQVIQVHLDYQRQSKWDYRFVVEAILFVLKTASQWRNLPTGYPPWQTVYWYFRKWSADGTVDLIVSELRRQVRQQVGRQATPSAAIIDSQTVKNTAYSTQDVGFDGGKKIKGRKRHLVVDTMGILLAIRVHSAEYHDSQSACWLANELHRQRIDLPALRVIYADKGYQGRLGSWLKKRFGWRLEIVKTYTQTAKPHFLISPKRWIVERSFAWLETFRRLAKDFERQTTVSEAFVKWAFVALLSKKLKP